MTDAAGVRARGRTQAERRSSTRSALLDAAADVMVELGGGGGDAGQGR